MDISIITKVIFFVIKKMENEPFNGKNWNLYIISSYYSIFSNVIMSSYPNCEKLCPVVWKQKCATVIYWKQIEKSPLIEKCQ